MHWPNVTRHFILTKRIIQILKYLEENIGKEHWRLLHVCDTKSTGNKRKRFRVGNLVSEFRGDLVKISGFELEAASYGGVRMAVVIWLISWFAVWLALFVKLSIPWISLAGWRRAGEKVVHTWSDVAFLWNWHHVMQLSLWYFREKIVLILSDSKLKWWDRNCCC